MSVTVREPQSTSVGKKQRPLWMELLVVVGIALVLAVIIKTFLAQAFYVPSESMERTLMPNDRIIVEKVSSWTGGELQRGDIVVFKDPGGWLNPAQVRTATGPMAKALEAIGLYPTGGHLVKRVIGVGGDTVRCCDAKGRMEVNGTPLNESYLAPGDKPSMVPFTINVPKGYIWVQGDHRSDSEDSRYHRGGPAGGAVPVDDVVGRVVALVWPWGHARTFPRPATYAALER